jgi:acetoin utilization protein AcuB
MTEEPTTISPNDSALDALRTLEQLSIRHLPVVDDAGELVGVLSDRDLRNGMAAGTRVVEVMNSNVIQAMADDELTTVAELMVDNTVGAIPIVDERGVLVGIVSYVDILKSLAAIERPGARETPENKPAGSTATRIKPASALHRTRDR